MFWFVEPGPLILGAGSLWLIALVFCGCVRCVVSVGAVETHLYLECARHTVPLLALFP